MSLGLWRLDHMSWQQQQQLFDTGIINSTAVVKHHHEMNIPQAVVV